MKGKQSIAGYSIYGRSIKRADRKGLGKMLIAGFIYLGLFMVCWLLLRSPSTTVFDKLVSEFAYSHRRPWLTKVMLFFTELGKPLGVILVFLPQFFFPENRLQMALPAGLSAAVSWWLAFILKRVIKRPRPMGQRLVEESDHSFPSFHATSSAAIYVSFALGGFSIWPQLWLLWCTIPVLLFLLIGASRVYLGVHYLSDIIGGWLFGAAAAFFTAFLLR